MFFKFILTVIVNVGEDKKLKRSTIITITEWVLSLSRHRVTLNTCNGNVKFSLINDKSLHTKDDSKRKRFVSLYYYDIMLMLLK